MEMMNNGAAPYIGMILSQFAQVGLMIIGKIAMSTGMTNFTFVTYSNLLASLILLPSFFFHRSSLHLLSFRLISGFFLLGVLGCIAQLTGYAGINYTNASFASAMLNLIPGFTFIFAIVFRMEKVDCTSGSTIAKSMGTIVSIAGSFIVTLYQGPQILKMVLPTKLHDQYLHMQETDWVMGGLFLAVDCAAASAFLIVQAAILKSFPAESIIVFFYCFFAAILSSATALIVGTDSDAWAFSPRTRLFAVLYSGVFGSAFQVSVNTWCLHRRGPLFVSVFHPLGIVIAAVLSIIFLGDKLYLGSLAGWIIIVIGFYSVMWGKAEEMNAPKTIPKSIGEKVPLLQAKDDEMEAQ